MVKAPSYQIDSESSYEAPPSLNHLAKELKSLKISKMQESLLKKKDRMEKDQHLATLKEELRRRHKE